MELFSYPATVTEAYPGDFVVRFADLPEAITGGSTVKEALANAPDCLAVAIEGYLERDWPLPPPRAAKEGEHAIPLDPQIAGRAILKQVMQEQGLTNVDLAERMKRDEKAIRRILSGRQASFSMTLAALKAVGVLPALSV